MLKRQLDVVVHPVRDNHSGCRERRILADLELTN
jgi:hypothetical protein